MQHAIRWSILPIVLASTACGGASRAAGSAQGTPSAQGAQASGSRQRTRSDMITRAMIEGTSFPNAYELVRALKGNWLNPRGPDSINGPSSEVQVHLDEMRAGGVAQLRDIHPNDIASIQYFDPITASGRWGLGYAAGAIVVTTRKR